MWKSYAVKADIMKTKYSENPETLINNTEINDLELKWLFHGTSSSAVQKIVHNGLDRAFAGRNGTSFGKGVYFTTDAAYAWNFATPCVAGAQRMLLCRVAVGDYCKGKSGDVVPGPKPGTCQHFDSTVNCEVNPTIYVAYHDAQAYPEYLVTFQRTN
jgi:poly [ADP-ribose] polymerase 10/14/15